MADQILSMLDQVSAEASKRAAPVKHAADLIPYIKIPDDSGLGLVRYEEWPHVLRYLKFLETSKNGCVVKGRQLGFSWASALYALYKCGWFPYQSVCSVNYTQDEAKLLVQRMKVLWHSLPAELRPPAEWNTEEARFANGSTAFCVATKNTSGAGRTVTDMFIDEAGLIGNLADNRAALFPAAQGGHIWMFSTARDAEGLFYDVAAKSKNGEGEFKYFSTYWWEHPKRNPETPEGRAWHAAELEKLGPKLFRREHEGEFERPGSAYFGDELLKALEAKIIAPKQTIWPGNRLRIYKLPVQGVRYRGGVDVAEGMSDDGDFSTAKIVDNSGYVCATYQARVDVNEFAEDLKRLAVWYNNAWLAIEANNHGHAVTGLLYHSLKYRKIFYESDADSGGMGKIKARLGILTTAQTKPAMLAHTERALRTGKLTDPDKATHEEAKHFVRANGSYGAQNGFHDDLVMAQVLAWHAMLRRVPTCQ